jgi:hypothetical protein
MAPSDIGAIILIYAARRAHLGLAEPARPVDGAVA